MTTRQARWQQKHLAEGLCASCGRRKLRRSKRLCNACLVRQRVQQRTRKGLLAQAVSGNGRTPLCKETA